MYITSTTCFCCFPMLTSISVDTEISGIIFGGGGGLFAGYFRVSLIYQGPRDV